MISVLVIGADEADTTGWAVSNPSVEVLAARGVENALEKLGRNRRIDAVLFLRDEDTAEIVEAIREDNPAHPPLFLASGRPPVPGTRVLEGRRPEELIGLLLRELEG